MPYIDPDSREYFNTRLAGVNLISAGELNYCFTELSKQFLALHGESYATYNAIIGVLECCKQEIYRRKVSAYENRKIQENGDVF